jgi:hypothetical protein
MNTNIIECEDILEVVKTIFSEPPKSPHTYQMDVQEEDSRYSSHQIFRILGQFLTHGMVFLYGDDVCIDTLTLNQINTLQQYLHSIGWKAIINPSKSPRNYPLALPFKLSIPLKNSINYAHIIFEPYVE